ncbi:alpha/beta hydrolase [Tautonia plasticadhaerens]|uniref:Alpha/beta hydrolase family protein n=1 Tax=Tautonia plasticadhaerens TaxID=2527974 RepID=A0A518HDM8_9BACT|nr:alpha/beta fold hydrolase [Tautonia plasticadhaerens]QDV38964.1 Alpha/beta hydrolase family protein [Tautonia plasticadhaerens]
MGSDRWAVSGESRRGWGPAPAGAAMLGIALATATAGAAWGTATRPQEEPPAPAPARQEPPAPPQEPARRPRSVPRTVPEKAEGGGLRLPPAGETPEDLADRPGADPLAPAGGGAMRAGADGARPDVPPPARPPAAATVIPEWPFHYELTLAGVDGSPLAARYYPSEQGATAAVVMLVHDLGAGRSAKDFDDPIAELAGQGLAGHLQELGYAVVAVDLRGHGQSPSRASRGEEGASPRMVGDLQAVYRFLLDRHNRRELNLAKFGVVGLGTGANLAAIWAATPGAAVSIEGRTSDLAGLALISPKPEAGGRPIGPVVSGLAPRVPMLLEAGSKDAESADAVRELEPVVARQRLSRVDFIETRQPATNLLRFAPDATRPLLSFLDNVVKIRADEWEPRYNLEPVLFANVRVVNRGEEPADAAPADAAGEPVEPDPAPAPVDRDAPAAAPGGGRDS